MKKRLKNLVRRDWMASALIALFSVGAVTVDAAPVLANIGVSPLRATVALGESSAAFTINNPDPSDVAVQAEVFRWERVAGADKLTKSSDWILNPPVVSIPGLGSRVMRMALKRPAPSPEEVAYRLVLTEVHAPAIDRGMGVIVKMHVSLPIFIAPAASSKSRPEWSAKRDGDRVVVVTLKNGAASHVHVNGFVFTDANGKPLENRASTYVFAGETRNWSVQLPAGTDTARLRLQAETDAGPQTIPVAAP